MRDMGSTVGFLRKCAKPPSEIGNRDREREIGKAREKGKGRIEVRRLFLLRLTCFYVLLVFGMSSYLSWLDVNGVQFSCSV